MSEQKFTFNTFAELVSFGGEFKMAGLNVQACSYEMTADAGYDAGGVL